MFCEDVAWRNNFLSIGIISGAAYTAYVCSVHTQNNIEVTSYWLAKLE